MFPGLFLQDEQVEEEEICEVTELVLYDSVIFIYDIYSILQNYLSEYYAIDSAIMLALIQDMELPLQRTLELLPQIHSGYVSVVVQHQGDTDGR